MRAHTIASLTVVVAFLSLAGSARAQQCPPASQVPDHCITVCGHAATAGDQLVGLEDELALRSDCAFSVARHDGAPLAAGRATQVRLSYAELWARVAQGAPFVPGRVNLVSAVRTGARGAAPERVGLEPCTFDVATLALRPEATRVTRSGSTDCDADRLTFVLVRGASADAWLAAAPSDAVTLAGGTTTVPLPDAASGQRWTLYARTSARETPLLRLAELGSRLAATPLQQYLGAAHGGTPPFELARTVWGAQGGARGGFGLARGDQASASVWDELLAALDAGLATLTWTETGESVALGVDADGGTLRLPDAFVDARMRAKLGEAGARLVPTGAEWSAWLSGASLCVSASYRPLAPGASAQPPICAALSAIVAAVAPQDVTVTVSNRMRVLSAKFEPGSVSVAPDALPVTTTDAVGAVGSVLATGDELSVTTTGEVCASVDDHVLAPVTAGAAGGPVRFVVDRPGVLELRAGAAAECNARTGRTLLRAPVVDPVNDWSLPDVHGHACGRSECTPWSTLPHDDDTTFRLDGSRSSLTSTLRTTADVRALARLSRQLPLAAHERAGVAADDGPPLYVTLSRGDVCPATRAGFQRDRPDVTPADVDAAATDTAFHAFLVTQAGDTARCLATFTFRVGHPRALVVTDGIPVPIELGVLGDPRAFVTFDGTLGVLGDLAWARISFTRWLGLQVGVPFIAAIDLAHAGNQARIGAFGDAILELGIPDILPRLVGVGVFVGYFPAQSQAWFGGLVTLDLATLADGGVRLLRELER